MKKQKVQFYCSEGDYKYIRNYMEDNDLNTSEFFNQLIYQFRKVDSLNDFLQYHAKDLTKLIDNSLNKNENINMMLYLEKANFRNSEQYTKFIELANGKNFPDEISYSKKFANDSVKTIKSQFYKKYGDN